MKMIRKMVAPTIWLVVISFALWGAQSFFLGFKKETLGAGKAFGKIVTFKQYQDASRSAELLLNRKDGPPPTPVEIETAAWQNIVLGAEARREKIFVSDEEVVNEINRLFGVNDRMDQAIYTQWITRNFGEQPRAFEERIREILKIQKLLAKHQEAQPEVSEAEVRAFFFNEQNKVTVDYVRFTSVAEAQSFVEQLAKNAQFWDWEIEKNKENSNVSSLGPVTIDVFMAVLKISQADADYLLALSEQAVSKPLSIKEGSAVFRLIKKEIAPESIFDEKARAQYQANLIERKKQTAFFDWWNDVMERARLEKFTQAEAPPDTETE